MITICLLEHEQKYCLWYTCRGWKQSNVQQTSFTIQTTWDQNTVIANIKSQNTKYLVYKDEKANIFWYYTLLKPGDKCTSPSAGS